MARAWIWVVIGFIGCSSGRGGGGGGSAGTAQAQQACKTFCDQRQQAACTSTEPAAECESMCAEDASLEVLCASQFAALVNCGASAPMQCGPNGAAQITVDCTQQVTAYDDCLSDQGWVSSGPTCAVYTCAGACSFRGCVECAQDTDCAPTEACVLDKCRQRCLGDADCPGARCVSGECGDQIGTPCADSLDCYGSSCINVDANLVTVEPYCSLSCVGSACPQGYACQDYECRRQ